MSRLLRDRCVSSWLALIVIAGCLAIGCNQNPRGPDVKIKSKEFACKDSEPITVTSVGVQPDATYVCDDDTRTVTWTGDNSVTTFEIEFQDWPFEGSAMTIKPTANNSVTSKKVLKRQNIKVFKYQITITPKNGGGSKICDPHIVSGGGVANY